jgi:alanyl-tRNA synthetase
MLRRTERYKGGMRLEFVCGARAVRDYQAKNRLLLGLASALNTGYAELPSAVERLRAAEEAQRKALEQAEAKLLAVEAAELLAEAERVDGAPVVVHALDERSLESARLLARHIAEGGGVALLGVRGAKAQLVFQRAAGLPYDMGALLRLAAERVGGRGGGRPEAAQGGGPEVAGLDDALQAALAELRSEK